MPSAAAMASVIQARARKVLPRWVARAAVDAGEVDHSTAITARVFHLAEGLAPIRPMARARLMAKRLEPHRPLTLVGALLEPAKG